jgi:tRNA threonylcarbamoyladenosine biosynthesis protein TsaE
VHLIRFLSASPGETRDFGRKIGKVLKAGDVVALRGDLGAGKSVLARGILDALGVKGDMPSPSFVIVAGYETPIPVNHIDLYRIEGTAEAVDLGLQDLLGSDAVCVVEWADRLGGLLPPSAIEVDIEDAPGENRRIVSIQAGDDDVKRRLMQLAAELVRFSCG